GRPRPTRPGSCSPRPPPPGCWCGTGWGESAPGPATTIRSASTDRPAHPTPSMTQTPVPPPPPSVADILFQGLTRAAGIGILTLVATLVAVLFWDAWPVLSRAGEYELFTSTEWVPKPPGGGTPTFGALAFVWGTAVSSLIAMVIAVPLGVASAAYLSE